MNKKITLLIFTATALLFTGCAASLDSVNVPQTSGFVADNTSENSTSEQTTTQSATTQPTTTLTTNSPAVGDDYFDDALFIGNSLMVDYCDEIGIDDWRRIAYVGLDVKEAFSQKVELPTGTSTLVDAIKNSSGFTKAYIEFGLNELGWVYSSVFIDYYEQIIDVIWEVNPDCIIYVQSLLPVSQKKSDNDEYENNPNTRKYNELLKEMCERKHTNYIDLVECLGDENGVLPDGVSTDGVHIGKGSCLKWQQYLASHTA